MDVSEESFNIKENGIFFYPSKFDTCDSQKKAITEAIVETMKEVADLSNANIARNAQCLLSGKKSGCDGNVLWVDSSKEASRSKKLKMSY